MTLVMTLHCFKVRLHDEISQSHDSSHDPDEVLLMVFRCLKLHVQTYLFFDLKYDEISCKNECLKKLLKSFKSKNKTST